MGNSNVSAAQPEAFSFTLPDARAEKGERRVTVVRDLVCIKRRYAGMAMRLNVPASAYRGVALSLLPTRTGGSFYRISLVHADADLTIVLGEALDDREIVADWNRWSQYFAKSRLVERAPGKFEEMEHNCGGIARGEAIEPRRTRVTRQRRGRFLARRKPGQPERSAVRFDNAREIICYE